jgi:hypothetical protein
MLLLLLLLLLCHTHIPCQHTGGLISAIFDETFGVLLYAAGRWGHFDCTMVFTARLEVDYKKVRAALKLWSYKV